MLKKLRERLPELSEPNIPNKAIPTFRQLVAYIDGGLSESYQKEGDERAAMLVTHMLNLRDFMTRQITENGMRQSLMAQINALVQEIENEEAASEEPAGEEEATKKNNQDDSLTETS